MFKPLFFFLEVLSAPVCQMLQRQSDRVSPLTLPFHHCSFQYDSDVSQVLLFYGDYLSDGNCYEFPCYLDKLDLQYLQNG